mmetsp:Transcript_101488/g.217310  ORF Transcript_101488/g.217310 Transcript_101488/m.217310 type:complete len:500 (+) Transcript_101488:94-1593(+)
MAKGDDKGKGKGSKGSKGGKGGKVSKGAGKERPQWVAKPDANSPRDLGELSVPPMCLGMMSIRSGNIHAYDLAKDDEEAFKVIEKGIELGYNFLDTSDVYGPNTCEEFVGECVERFGREKLIIATKFSLCHPTWGGPCGEPGYVKECLEGSLKRMKTDYVDLYYMHRMDPKTPIEDTMGALKELKEAGKIKHIGLSECPGHILKRANKVCKVSCVQMEWSLMARDLEQDIVPICRELKIGIVAYSPLARGMLTGTQTKENLPKDWRADGCGRYVGNNFDSNLKLVEAFKKVAEELKCTPSQLALAWVLSRGKDVVPLFGTKQVARLEDNIKAAQLAIDLTAEDWRSCERAVHLRSVAGSRYTNMAMSYHSELLRPPVKLRKAKFTTLDELNPESKAVNVLVKVTKVGGEPDAVKGWVEAQVADTTGMATILLRSPEQVALCTEEGKTLRLQNGQVLMVKGYIRLEVTKWGKLAVSEEPLEGTLNLEKDISAVEYELVAS